MHMEIFGAAIEQVIFNLIFLFLGFFFGVIFEDPAKSIWYAFLNGINRLARRGTRVLFKRTAVHAPEKFHFGKGNIEIDYVILDGTGESENIYQPENLITHFSPGLYNEFPQDIVDLKTKIEFEENLKREQGKPYCWNGSMVLIENVNRSRTETDESMVLELWFRESDYYSFLATNFAPDQRIIVDSDGNQTSVWDKYIQGWNDYLQPIPFLTTSFGVSLAVITRDNYLPIVYRSNEVYGYKNIYDVSVVEGVRPGVDVDAFQKIDFYKTATRGIFEELGLKIEGDTQAKIKFLSFGVKPKDNQYGLLGFVDIKQSLDELLFARSAKAGRDDWENSNIIALDISSPETILRFIADNDPKDWSPNGLVCIVHTLIYRYGQKRILNKIRKLK